ncbi:MAG: phospholipase D family protein [Chitinophagaceae bacterium]
MAEFLTTSGTSHFIEDIIIEASSKLVLITPFLKLSKTFYERLKDATNRGVNVKIIFGKEDLKPNEKNSLAALKNVELYFLQNLHAKCYFNEVKMVITSMNMYEFSQKNNREMGVLINVKDDKLLFDKATAEANSIIQHSDFIALQKTQRIFSPKEKQTTANLKKTSTPIYPKLGYCLRCESRIPYNPTKPYCSSCFASWAQWENPTFNETVCHGCGEFTNPINMNKPLCNPCFKSFPSRQEKF